MFTSTPNQFSRFLGNQFLEKHLDKSAKPFPGYQELKNSAWKSPVTNSKVRKEHFLQKQHSFETPYLGRHFYYKIKCRVCSRHFPRNAKQKRKCSAAGTQKEDLISGIPSKANSLARAQV